MVEIAAKVSSRGRLTVPKAVRDALGVVEGDRVVFRVDGQRVVLARVSDFLSLAGSVVVPAHRRHVTWGEVRRRARSTRAANRR